MVKNLISKFPSKYTPREKQLNVLREIEDAVQGKHKFIIINAPTGSGKSMFSASLANCTNPPSSEFVKLVDDGVIFDKDSMGGFVYEDIEDKHGAFILTTTKALQDQYDKLFDDCFLLKGKRNYVCSMDTEFDADAAPCLVAPKLAKECLHKKRCEYFKERDSLIKSRFGVLNYSMFLSLPDHVRKKNIIVCDEASELEDELVGHYSADIEYGRLFKMGINIKKLYTDNHSKACEWLTDLYTKIRDAVDKLDSKQVKGNNVVYINKLRGLKDLKDRINKVLLHWDVCEYVIERDNDKVIFVPLKVNALSESIFNKADIIILMSATIIDVKTFTKTLGIKDYKFIDVESTFDPKSSPIYCPGKHDLSYGNIDKNLPRVAEQALQICDHYKGKKGIIHTHSFKITQALQKKATDKRFLFREDSISNEHILEEHFSNDADTILVSPSLGYGTDLYGKYGEFQIIIKLPYLPLGSKRIKMLADNDKDWYIMKMLVSLVQMCGRIIRSKDDIGDTFILDGSAFSVLKTNWSKLPKWFKGRLA